MYNHTGIKKLTAVMLVIMSVCMMLSAQAETITADMLFGEVIDDTYENAFIGLGCTLEGWHYYSDEELESVNKRTKEALSDDLAELIDQNIGIMMVERPDGMQNVNIQLQNVEEYVSVYSSAGLQSVASISLSGFKTTLENAGFTDIVLSVGELSIGGQTFACVIGEYKIKGVPVHFKQMWDLRDIYLVTTTVTTVLEDTTDEVFSRFFLV